MSSFLTIFIPVMLILITCINFAREGVDFTSFMCSKLSLQFLPPVFPQNTLEDAKRFRNFLYLGSKLSIVSDPDILSQDVSFPGSRLDQSVRVRIYNQGGDNDKKDVLIYFFPGAWIIGGINDNDSLCKHFAKYTGFVVVAVDYSLVPEYPFPHGFNDARASLIWTKHNIASYGGNPKRIFVSGESAGGNLAAAVTARNLDAEFTSEDDRVSVVGLLLVYPPLAANFSTESYVKYSRYNGMLTTAVMKHAWELYRASSAIADDDYTFQPLLTPLHILAHFPPTHIVVAEYDVLRDDSLLFAEKLQAASVTVTVANYNTTVHGFFGRSLFPAGLRAVREASDVLLRF
jgi:acetyl esterase